MLSLAENMRSSASFRYTSCLSDVKALLQSVTVKVKVTCKSKKHYHKPLPQSPVARRHPGATRGLDACLTSTLWRPPDGSLVFVLNKLHKKQTGRWQRSENGGVVWSPDGAPFSPTRVVFVLGFVSLINFLISGKKQMSCLF